MSAEVYEDKLLEVKNLQKTYSNGFTAVKGVSFSMDKGSSLGLVGESGSGKSTLGRCILMIEKISGGEILMEGESICELEVKKRKKYQRKMQAVFQNPTSSLNSKRKIIDSLMEPLDFQPYIEPEFLRGIRHNRKKVSSILMEMVHMPSRCLNAYPDEISIGQRQRVTIARAISVQPSLIVLDEPTASLDVSVQARILNLLKDLQEELNMSYLFISHDISAVNFMCKEIMVMKNGELIDCFLRDNILDDLREDYTKKLIQVFEE